jgi:type II secretory pathway component PulF
MAGAGDFAELNLLLARAARRGESMREALEEAAETLASDRLRDACAEAARRMGEGASLAQAMAARVREFPSEYVAVVEAGERGGSLADVLSAAADEARMRDRVERTVGRVRAYLVFGFGMVAVVLMVVGAVARKFSLIYEQLQMNDRLPELTTWLIYFAQSGILSGFALLVATVVGVGLWRLASALVVRSRWAFWVPMLAQIVRMRDLSAACSVAAMRLATGAAMSAALGDAIRAVRNWKFRRELRKVRARVEDGASLSESLFYVRFFPRTLGWAVSLGEQRADVPGVLRSFGSLYRAQLARQYDVLLLMLAPIAVLALANVVMVAVMVLWLPLVEIIHL